MLRFIVLLALLVMPFAVTDAAARQAQAVVIETLITGPFSPFYPEDKGDYLDC